MRKHESFILTPITTVMDEISIASSLHEDGVSSFPMGDYLMQSLFLRMTGFQEQKVKCILWELATDNVDLRYERFKNKPIGEGSSYSDKNTVFLDLVSCIKNCNANVDLLSDAERQKIFDDTKAYLAKFSELSYIKSFSQRQYYEFCKIFAKCGKQCLLHISKKNHEDKLVDMLAHCDNCAVKSSAKDWNLCKFSTIKQAYECMIAHRNRSAHNTVSFQQNLPSLDRLRSKDYLLDNYYIRFAILMIIDQVFVQLFKKYIQLNPESFML